MPESEESPSELFQRTLKVSPVLAEKMAENGLTTLEEVAYYPFNEMLELTGLDTVALQELRRIARLYLRNIDFGRLE